MDAADSAQVDGGTGTDAMGIDGGGVDARTPDAGATFDARPSDSSGTPMPLRALRVVTANVGTGGGTDGSFTSDLADTSDEYYGNGLSWQPAVDAMRVFFEMVDPDIVVFQETFHSPECEDIPSDHHRDFVCETWSSDDATVALSVLPGDWQLVCHPGKSDKCAAVNRRVGTFRGCDGSFCLEGMDGYSVDDCGNGARVARGTIEFVDGTELVVVNVHGTSGTSGDDMDCREAQVEQVFLDLGDGMPGVNGPHNLVMGDFNTDPGRATLLDGSAQRWNELAESAGFDFISEVGWSAPPSYAGLANIDHVLADTMVGSCWIPGVTEGRPPVFDSSYFDHSPVVCDVGLP